MLLFFSFTFSIKWWPYQQLIIIQNGKSHLHRHRYYSQNKRSSIFFTKGDSLDIRQCLNISILETTFSRTNFHNFPNSSQQTTGILGVSKRIVKKGERESWDSRDLTGNLGSQNLTLSTKNSRSSGQKNDKSILVMKFVDFYPSRNRNLKRSIGNVIFYFF